MPPGTRNALVPPSQNAFGAPPTLAEIQLAARTAQRPSPLTLGERAQEINYGLGRGFTNILQSNLDLAQALYQDPRAVGRQMLEGYGQLLAHPVDTVNNSLRSMWNRAKSSPAGLGEVVGENIDPRNWLKPRKVLRHELDVYHGTPHTFEPEEGAPLGRFRAKKIGTGEGAQAYGYGLYLAESPGVAKSYQTALSDNVFTVNGKELLGPASKYGTTTQSPARANLSRPEKMASYALDSAVKAGSADPAAAAIAHLLKHGKGNPNAKAALEIVRQWQSQGAKIKAGSFYKVDLPDAKIEQMMDWDKPLSQQPKAFQDAVAKLPRFQNPYVVSKTTGGEAYRELAGSLGSTAKASDLLRQLGIPGVKYLDAGSRAGEKGTRNFVVFPGEEQHLNILSRD